MIKNKIFFLFLGLCILGFGLAWQAYQLMPVQASTPPGYMAISATTSQVTLVQGEAKQVFASSSCVSRIVSSGSVNLWIMFTDSATLPAVNVGHLHGTSTTVGYDSGLYGCGLWRIYNPVATTAVFTITEFQSFK